MSKFTHSYGKHKVDCKKVIEIKYLKPYKLRKHLQDSVKKSLKYLLAFNYIFKKNITSFFVTNFQDNYFKVTCHYIILSKILLLN